MSKTDSNPPTPPAYQVSDGRAGLWMMEGALLGVVVLTIFLPAIGAMRQVLASDAAATTERAFVWWTLARTVGYCGLIGGLSAALGWSAAWVLRRGGRWSAVWTTLIAVPLLMPTYLAYTGWGLLRGPGSALGDWLASGDPSRTVIANQILAVGGLALWGWPIAAFVIASGARRVPDHLLDALDLEPTGFVRRGMVLVRLVRTEVLGAIGLVALVMGGSAIPLHLAQIETTAIHIWKFMTLTPSPGAVWPAALPLLGAAAVGGWLMVRAFGRPALEIDQAGERQSRRAGWGAPAAALVVWSLSVLAPLLLFVGHLRDWSSIGRFWRQGQDAILGSATVGLWVGLACAGVCCAVFAVLTCTKGRATRGGVWLLIFVGLCPGVLVGAATLGFWTWPRLPHALGSGMLPIVLAHVARFGFLGALAGWMLAKQETSDQIAARRLIAGDGLSGWWTLRLRPNLPIVAGVALACATLSVHEIEATVQLATPGSASIAQRLLDLLHYARDEDLCAGCITMLAGGTAAALAAGWLVSALLSPRD